MNRIWGQLIQIDIIYFFQLIARLIFADLEQLNGYTHNRRRNWFLNRLKFMYYAASVSGTIDTMPDNPGLAVWKDGHIGVYIGNGEVIEATGTSKGVVKTKLSERSFTHWLKIEYINYD